MVHFSKDKSPSPNGWTMEFCLRFFDLLGGEWTEALDESQRLGLIPALINETYISLISKRDRLVSFDDYRPVALCNLLYKIIVKIILDMIKPILGKFISE